MLRVYSLSFAQTDIDYTKLATFLKTTPGIVGYWNYIPGVYFIKSYNLFEDLIPKFTTHFAGRQYVLAEVTKSGNLWLANGFAPKDSWNWFVEQPEGYLGLLGMNLKPTT